jgi:hypothetical protein
MTKGNAIAQATKYSDLMGIAFYANPLPDGGWVVGQYSNNIDSVLCDSTSPADDPRIHGFGDNIGQFPV